LQAAAPKGAAALFLLQRPKALFLLDEVFIKRVVPKKEHDPLRNEIVLKRLRDGYNYHGSQQLSGPATMTDSHRLYLTVKYAVAPLLADVLDPALIVTAYNPVQALGAKG